MSVRSRRATHSVYAVGLLIAASIAGCGQKADAPPAANAGGDGATATAAPAVQPGFATGRVLAMDGKPIAIPGTKIELSVTGNSDAGRDLSYTPTVGADGSWKTKLAAGVYHAPKASILVPFNGRTFRYDLVPSKPVGDFDAKDGCVCDLIWHVTGPKPIAMPNPDPSNWTHYFGAAVTVSLDRYADGPQTPLFGDDKVKVEFDVTPVGKMIDGSEGTPRTYVLGFYSLLNTCRPDKLHDLPVGSYKVTGQRVNADGSKTPLKLRVDADRDYKPVAEFAIYTYAGGDEAIGPTVGFAVK